MLNKGGVFRCTERLSTVRDTEHSIVALASRDDGCAEGVDGRLIRTERINS
jgi:hypothetical protein